MSTEVVVGRVGGPHGIHGEMAVRIRTDEPDRRFTVGASLTAERDDQRRVLRLIAVRPHKADLLVTFAGITDREAAVELSGSWLLAQVAEHDRPEDEDEFYDHQLIGLAVVSVVGDPLGAVCDVIHLPMQDVLAVDLSDDRQVLVPFVADIVTDVDLSTRQVTVAPPAGLFDVESGS